MARKLDHLIDTLQQAETLEALQARIIALRDFFEVEHLVYHSVNAAGGQYAALTYSDDWVQRYIHSNYDRIDPVVQGAYSRFGFVDWKTLDWTSKSVRAFREESAAAGVATQGLTLPMRGPTGQFAIFTVNTCTSDAEWSRFADRSKQDILLVASLVNEKALELEGAIEAAPMQSLSPREKDSLTMLALGLNRSASAEKLGISEHTLRVYIESARFKLAANNTTHAVARAVALGLILI
ncbi:autoinducer binding domain-containing protein [Alphaproteobacteria bacterium KMM 3653]|uniref:Autoinducer binding domain-containing protein n=1 Tax=Harenicola maris TaxID=2841044 RepID=A0AAP2CUT5_9RHOB|nr:autoinducer binding domain-containing protein [Harenicola maris]